MTIIPNHVAEIMERYSKKGVVEGSNKADSLDAFTLGSRIGACPSIFVHKKRSDKGLKSI